MGLRHMTGDALVFDGWVQDLAAVTAATRDYLIGQGNQAWDVDTALRNAGYGRGWWSDTYGGFTHDCADHLPEDTTAQTCYPDSVPVTTVAGLPPALLARTGEDF